MEMRQPRARPYRVVQPGIHTASGAELQRCAALDNTAGVERNDLIHSGEGRQPVGDDEDGPIAAEFADRAGGGTFVLL